MTDTLGTDTTDERHLRILSEGGKSRVLLDGVDVSTSLFGVHLSLSAFDPPHAVLEVAQRSTLSSEFDGMARVAVGEQPDPGPAAAAFLEAMDAKALEDAALAVVHEYEGQENALTKAMLAQLVRWANGRS